MQNACCVPQTRIRKRPYTPGKLKIGQTYGRDHIFYSLGIYVAGIESIKIKAQERKVIYRARVILRMGRSCSTAENIYAPFPRSYTFIVSFFWEILSLVYACVLLLIRSRALGRVWYLVDIYTFPGNVQYRARLSPRSPRQRRIIRALF